MGLYSLLSQGIARGNALKSVRAWTKNMMQMFVFSQVIQSSHFMIFFGSSICYRPKPSLPGIFHILIGKCAYFIIRFYYKAIK